MIKHDSLRVLATQRISEALQKMGQSLSEDEIYKSLVEPPNLKWGIWPLAVLLWPKL